jgi:hypothetical protein
MAMATAMAEATQSFEQRERVVCDVNEPYEREKRERLKERYEMKEMGSDVVNVRKCVMRRRGGDDDDEMRGLNERCG